VRAICCWALFECGLRHRRLGRSNVPTPFTPPSPAQALTYQLVAVQHPLPPRARRRGHRQRGSLPPPCWPPTNEWFYGFERQPLQRRTREDPRRVVSLFGFCSWRAEQQTVGPDLGRNGGRCLFGGGGHLRVPRATVAALYPRSPQPPRTTSKSRLVEIGGSILPRVPDRLLGCPAARGLALDPVDASGGARALVVLGCVAKLRLEGFYHCRAVPCEHSWVMGT